MLLLMATYGLRSCEVVALTLDDVDWRAGVIRIRQTKTRNELSLPLADEAADRVSSRSSATGRRSESLLSTAGANQAAEARGPEGSL